MHITAPHQAQSTDQLNVERKALRINLNPLIFGTFAEIGAGQEVARHFFRVGGAAGTIAKTMSAYDMAFSDAVYGKVGRYVSHDRLQTMLDHEYRLLLERLSEKRGAETTFFVFANTVAARSFKGGNECHGWLGVRFQTKPLGPANDIILHVRMMDRENVLQQHALGIIGVNLLHGAFYYREDPEAFIRGLLDDLSTERIEVDMIEFRGPDLGHVDNRLMSLRLVQANLTSAAMFDPEGRVLQPSAILYKRSVLIERGSFRPVTHINLDMMRAARDGFLNAGTSDPVALFEITLHNLLAEGKLDEADFLARADTLSALGFTVLISNYSEHYRLTSYFRRYSREPVGMVMGINTLLQLLSPSYYSHLEGGILEAIGRLFADGITLFVYPMKREALKRYVQTSSHQIVDIDLEGLPELVTARDIQIRSDLKHLYSYLIERGSIRGIEPSSSDYLTILSRDVLNQIRKGDPSWEKSVPPAAAQVIKDRRMFGLPNA